jgi:hypothetical protein
MEDTTAFVIAKELKAAGHTVFIEDQPKTRWPMKNSAAVTGDKDMDLADIEHCVNFIRARMMEETSPYTIETVADKKRKFPNASFAAW